MASLCTHCPVSGAGPGTKSARTPLFLGSHVAPPSRVSNTPTAEMPTHIRCGSVGWGTIVWRIRPPAPGPQVGRVGWFVSPSTCVHVAPPSALRKSPAGSTPANSVPSGPVASDQTVVTGSGPSSPYVSPTDEWVQVSPPSSLRHTAGPYHGLPPPARMAPLAGSTMRSWIGQPSHSGPRTDHSSRDSSLLEDERPLRGADEEIDAGHEEEPPRGRPAVRVRP